MKINMKIKISFYVAISCLCLILSCSSSSGNQLKEHRIEKFVVDPGMETKSMSKEQYTIDSIRSLVFPDSIKGIGISKIYNDGETVQNYTSDSESGNLSNDNTCIILISSSNKIYVGTAEGINLYDKKQINLI